MSEVSVKITGGGFRTLPFDPPKILGSVSTTVFWGP